MSSRLNFLPCARPHRQPHPGHVPTAIAELVDQFPMPAILVSRYQDVLAANPIAHALSPGFEVGQNLSRWRFLDPRPPWQAFRWRRITHSGELGALSSRRSHARC
ncbi:hypothetical protein [Mycobacterium sp.]|uniref:MmyB family transcriptional regulator n=1 Tax=Mycobacterium sp. TaxID=1785 RepID=UPI002C9021C5|nr:hypothetical protein [Mycobacterium sp.]HXB85814.1 hypothetical protein [Mycobacterium sp.]